MSAQRKNGRGQIDDISLTRRLFNDHYHFSFFKAVHLLEKLSPGRKPLGHTLTPRDEPVRFIVKPGFDFPPSDVAKLEPAKNGGPAEMEITFMGLLGPSGQLPDWYNELALQRIKEKDFGFCAFFDLFHHRFISHFYMAWKKYRIPEGYIRGAGDKTSHALLCLLGLGTQGPGERLDLPGEPLLFHSGILSRSIPSASDITAAVEYFSGAGSGVQQFVDRIVPLEREDQTQLGRANASLGENSICGSCTWENQTKFRVKIGTMKYNHFIRFLPAGDMLTRIFSLVGYMTGIEYEFEVRLVLEREETPPCIVGSNDPAAPRLGWSTWIKTVGVSHAEDPFVTFQAPSI